MSDWVIRTGARPEKVKPSKEAVLRLHAFVMAAEKLRPHKVLETMDPQLLNAENRVIIAPNEDAQEAATVGLIRALNALGHTNELTKKLVDEWMHARAAIAQEHSAQQIYYTR